MFDYAKHWRLFTALEKQRYCDGVLDGSRRAYFKTVEEFVPRDPDLARLRYEKGLRPFVLTLDCRAIVDVATDLYKDPANSFIFQVEMMFLAQDKLSGEDIESGLAKARKLAIEVHEFMESQKK